MRTLEDFLGFASRCTNYELRSPPPRGNARERHRFNLAPMRRICELLGHPEHGPAVRFLVAGTHGKGSVCHWLDGILQAAGRRTGRYLSPHLVHLTERVRVQGEPVDEEVWMAAAREAVPAFQAAMEEGLQPTFFDLVTGVCFVAHRQARVEAAILEVGLGGRLDSTNVVDPTVTVITEIDRDHTEILGHELRGIAMEKAGILRPGVPLCCQVREREAREAILGAASTVGAGPVCCLEPDRAVPWPLPSPGAHQQRNAALAAVAAGQALGPVPPRVLRDGLQRAGELPGRCQPVRAASGRQWILDGGHTPGAVSALVATLGERAPAAAPVVLVLGLARDKDARRLLELLTPLSPTLVVTPYDSPRATPAVQLAAVARAVGLPEVHEAGGAAQALELANRLAPDPGTRVVGGSFYLVGEVLRERLLEKL